MNTGDTIKKLRKSRNMTQAELGKQLGVAATTVSSWERGVAYPLMTVAKTMATFFGVPVSTIAGDENSEASAPLPIHSYPYIPADISAGTPERVDAITPDQLEQVAVPDAVMGKWAGHTDISLMRANGESMNRVIPNGSLIGVRHIEETSELNDGDIVVFDCDGEYAVKRFFNDRAHKQYIFQPDSDVSSFYPITHSYDDEELVDIVGKVVLYVVELD